MKKVSVIGPREPKKVLTQEEILQLFKFYRAYWKHNGDISMPHVELTSGMCSNEYFNCPEVLKHGELNEFLAQQLVFLLQKEEVKEVDWVIGSAYSGITFSYEVAKILKATHGFTKKDPADPTGKQMLWKRTTIPAGSKILQIEELITTSDGTFKKVRRAVMEGNSEPVDFVPIVGVLVHRPPKLPVDYKFNGQKIKIVSLIEKEVWAVHPKDCPLCKAGSPRLRPKDHWKELTQKR